jgi:manganese oxidase
MTEHNPPRRQFLQLGASIAAGAAALGVTPGLAHANTTTRVPGAKTHTPNGWDLPFEWVDGCKQFHLVAEEVEHEFAPGSKAKCWGYNGSAPGPTLQAVQGDRVRLLVTNRLGEATSVHWHGMILPSGMDGVSGLNQRAIQPGETYVYEFTLQNAGSHMYHPHADEMTQMALGMMGLFIVHPNSGEHVDRDFAILLHNFALHPGTYRPDPNVMQEFDLWTMNGKAYPATQPIICRAGERVRLRFGNLSMWNHPIHLHGHVFEVTGGDGGRWPKSQWRREVTEIVAVGQMRDIEFDALEGDWALHCHMSHHTMGPMAHDLPNNIGVKQQDLAKQIRQQIPGFMAMGEHGMSEHSSHMEMRHMQGPDNTLPMMTGSGPFGAVEMGGMFNVVKVRKGINADLQQDPGWIQLPAAQVAKRVSEDPNFGSPIRKPPIKG